MNTYSTQLAEWSEAFHLGDAPDAVIASAKLRILDVIGVMIASDSHESVKAARIAEADGASGGRGVHALMGRDELSLSSAAFINGVASAVLEFDDTHIVSNIHPSCVLVAATLPYVQAERMSGRAWLESFIAGSEILCRLGLVSPVRMHEVGLHPTSIYGVFAAAYAIARLRGLTVKTTCDAVGTAGSLTAGSIASFEDGTSTKTMHVGFAASAAVRAVSLAAAGVSGPARIFEGKFAWYASYVQSKPEFRYGVLTDELGTRWHSQDISSKLFPCAYTLMPFISASLALRGQLGEIDPADVREINCEIMPRSFRTVCEPLDEKRRPLTSWHGRISLQHTVAEALVLGRFDKNAYAEENLRNPTINALADKVVHVADEIAANDISRSRGVVTIVFNDGREVTHTVTDMLGTSTNPAGVDVYVDKFRSNVAGILSDDKADRLIDGLLNLEECEDVEALLAPLRG
jgi:2-methylcitrate dehydratase PrpD